MDGNKIYHRFDESLYASLRNCLDIINKLDEGPEKKEYINIYNVTILTNFLLNKNNVQLCFNPYPKFIKYGLSYSQLIKALIVYRKLICYDLFRKVLEDDDLFSGSEDLSIILHKFYSEIGSEKIKYITDFFDSDYKTEELLLYYKTEDLFFDNNTTVENIKYYFDNSRKLIPTETIEHILKLMVNNQHLVKPDSLMSILKYLSCNNNYVYLVFDIYRLAEKYDTKIEFNIDIFLSVLIYRWENRRSFDSNFSNNFKYFMSCISNDEIRYTLNELFSRIPDTLYLLSNKDNVSYSDKNYPFYNFVQDNCCASIADIISIRPECVSDNYVRSLFEKFTTIISKIRNPNIFLVYILKINDLLVKIGPYTRIHPDIVALFFSDVSNAFSPNKTFYEMLNDIEFNIIFKIIESKKYCDRKCMIEKTFNKLLSHNPAIIKNNIKYLTTIILENNCYKSYVEEIVKFARKNNLECKIREASRKYFIKQIANCGKKICRR